MQPSIAPADLALVQTESKTAIKAVGSQESIHNSDPTFVQLSGGSMNKLTMPESARHWAVGRQPFPIMEGLPVTRSE